MATKQLTHTAAEVDDAVSKRHSHANAAVLSGITAQKVSAWDAKQSALTFDDEPTEGSSNPVTSDGVFRAVSEHGGLQLGETSTTAYRGDRGKAAYEHSQATSGNPHNVTKSDVGLGNVDNTSDLGKPVSAATQSALDGKQAKQTFTADASTPSDGDFVLMQASSETGTTAILKRAVSKVWDYIKGKADSVYAAVSHNHAISDVTNLQSSLDGKQAALAFDDAPTAGSSNPVKSGGVKSALDGKADSAHSHAIGDVTGLQSALDGKAPSTHSHAISDVTGLQTALDGKQATLTAGTNITIVDNVISATGGGGTSVPCYYVNCHQSGGSWVLENPSELTPIYTALSAFISAPASYANASSMFIVLQPSNETTQVDWVVFNEIIRESASSPVFHVTFVTRRQGRRGTFDLTVNATQQTASLSFEPEAETLTEAQYAALTKDATRVYYVTANS